VRAAYLWPGFSDDCFISQSRLSVGVKIVSPVMFHKKKFDSCLFDYRRVGAEYRLEFLTRMSEEFCAACDKSEFQEDLYVGSGGATVTEIMNNPELYYANTAKLDENGMTKDQKIAHLEAQIKAKNQELNKIMSSKALKFGNAVALIPSTYRDAKKAIKRYGVAGTAKKAVKKVIK
jgi:hypothetical protein